MLFFGVVMKLQHPAFLPADVAEQAIVLAHIHVLQRGDQRRRIQCAIADMPQNHPRFGNLAKMHPVDRHKMPAGLLLLLGHIGIGRHMGPCGFV